MKKIILLLILVVGGAAGYFIGNYLGKKTVTNYTQHTDFVREIAELSTLEVSGIASLNQTNVTDGNIWNNISNYLGEKTILLNIPYTAKYGCTLGDTSLNIRDLGNGEVEISLNEPSLLSYEMRLDQMRQLSKKGLLILSKDDQFAKPQKQLYQETKAKLEGSQEHIAKAKVKIEEVLSHLMETNNLTAKFKWN